MTNARIAFNLLYLHPGNTGGAETYAAELIPRLARLASNVSFTAYMTREGAEEYGDGRLGVEVTTMPIRSSSRWQWPLFEQAPLAAAARRDHVDVLHSMALVGPVFTPRMRHVMTLHDVTFMKFAGSFARSWTQKAFATTSKAAALRADRIITDSESSKRDIVEFVGYPSELINVVPLAGRGQMPAGTPIDRIGRGRLTGKRYVMAVGSLLGHKNMPGLLEAFSRIDPQIVDLLVLTGFDIRKHPPFRDLIELLGIGDRVVTLGWVSEPELAAVYGHALCFVHASFMEGFGLPVLEAMENGLPVATSDATSLPEVGGAAVAYFDPGDTAQIARVVTELLTNDGLRAQLSTAGRERAALFSWDKTAEQTLKTYFEVFDSTKQVAKGRAVT